jgi:hypothetical protein
MSYSTIADIARQASLDLGFKVEMSVVDHPGLTNRMIQDPNSIDVADSEIWQTKVYVPAGVTQAVDTKKIAIWDKVTTLYTEGTFAASRWRARATRPSSSCRDAIDGTTFRDGPTQGDVPARRLQRRYARHPAGSDQAPDRELEGAAQPGVQGQGGDPLSVDRHVDAAMVRGDGPVNTPTRGT